MKILIIAPAWIGDAVMAQSLFMQLKALDPQFHLTVMVPRSIEPLMALMPEVDAVITTDFVKKRLELRKRFAMSQQLRRQFDWAIVLPNSLKSALIPWLAQVPLRTGWHGEGRYLLLNDRRKKPRRFPRMVDRYRALAFFPEKAMPASDAPQPYFNISKRQRQELLQQWCLNAGTPIVALCPGAAYGPSKRWPADHFAKLAQKCLAQGWQVWIFGGIQDQAAASWIIKHLADSDTRDCVNLVGRCSLHESALLLSLAWHVVANDSGLMHLGAALGCDLVCIYGGSSPTYTPPLTPRAKIFTTQLTCQPCFKRKCQWQHYSCLTQIKPQQIFLYLLEAWKINSAQQSSA